MVGNQFSSVYTGKLQTQLQCLEGLPSCHNHQLSQLCQKEATVDMTLLTHIHTAQLKSKTQVLISLKQTIRRLQPVLPPTMLKYIFKSARFNKIVPNVQYYHDSDNHNVFQTGIFILKCVYINMIDLLITSALITLLGYC